MSDIVGYSQWLGKLQPQFAFLNNYWCAMLANDMEETDHSETFKIPYFILEEELMREDNNVNHPDSYVSPALRHWLVHLLKPYDEKASVLNVEIVLRSFIHNKMDLPTGVTFPLITTTYFHNLPTECKLWIIYMIRNNKKPSRALQRIATDILSNDYYVAPDCRLYVRTDQAEKNALPIDETKMKGKPWESLYRFIHNETYILLSQDQDGWNVVRQALTMFKLNDLHHTLLRIIPNKINKQNLNNMMQGRNRSEFAQNLNKLGPIPSIELWEKKINNQKKKKSADENGNTAMNALKTGIGAMNVKGSIPAKYPTQVNSKNDEIIGKCWNFPKCPLKGKCKYAHPDIPCTKFPKCPRGWQCLFLHDLCPNDADCVAPNCAYDHLKVLKTTEPPQRAPATGRQGTLYRAPSMTNLTRAPSMTNLTRAPSMTNLTRAPSMTNLSRAPSTTNLSRSPSENNLSTCSNRTGGRRVSFCASVDDDKPENGKASKDQKPAGILCQSKVSKKGVCRFRLKCTNSKCDYTHPDGKCPVFPSCPNGGACFYKHEVCKNDGVCCREDCDFEHMKKLHQIANNWCKNGSRCKRNACKFMHPKECIGPCPSKGNCWMYHPPGRAAVAAAAAAAAPAAPPQDPQSPPVPPRRKSLAQQSPASGAKPSVPPKPTVSPQQDAGTGSDGRGDYAGAPLQRQPANSRYGSEPESNFRGNAGFQHHPRFEQGQGYREYVQHPQVPGYVGSGNHGYPHHASHYPAAVPPPPSYSELTQEEREVVARKNERFR